MELLRWVTVVVKKWRFRSRAAFVVLCVLALVMLGILQSKLQTNRTKINTVYTGDQDHGDGSRIVQSLEKNLLINDQRRLQSLVIEKNKEKLQVLDKRGRSSSGENTQKSNNDVREIENVPRMTKENNFNKTRGEVKEGQHSRHLVEDINVYKINRDKYNADEKEHQALMNELYNLLLKLEKEGIDLNEENKMASAEKVQDHKQFPFHPLQYPQRLDMGKLVKTFVKNGNLPSNPINKWKYSPIINPSHKCNNSQGGVFLLFIVKTRPENFVKRKVIRETWADEKRFPNMRAVFSIGIPRDSWITQKIKLESLKYGDVLLMDYIDSYNNLTLKTTSGINWAVAHCNVAEFVVSVDDDMYVATDFLLQHLKDMPPEKADRLYHGHLYHNTEPVRHGEKDAWESKWVITKKEYPFDNYPDYIFGGFVVMSMKTVLEMSVAIPYTRPINMEDVYLGIVASRLGIVATNTDLVDFYITYSNVEKFKTLIASHYYSSSHMLKKAWECHLSFVYSDVEKSVFCLYLKPELQKLKQKITDILKWIDLSDNAL